MHKEVTLPFTAKHDLIDPPRRPTDVLRKSVRRELERLQDDCLGHRAWVNRRPLRSDRDSS